MCDNHKLDLGCPTEEKCTLFQNFGGLKACELCPKKLKVNQPPLDESYLPRINYLTRLENMEAVGCRFSMNELSPDTWDELILLSGERSRMQNQINKQMLDAAKEHPTLGVESQKKIDEQRKEMGIPAPGQSIFK